MSWTSDDAPLVSGPLTATLHGAELRDIRVSGHIALDGIYAAARDEQWGTVPATTERRITRVTDGFIVEFASHYGSFGIMLHGRYEAHSGRLEAVLDVHAIRDVAVNRVGFCLLYPVELADAAMTARTASGVVTTRFPLTIAPDAIVTDVLGLGYEVAAGQRLDIDFGRDPFELEDHRNWCDSGWKAYSPPIDTPRPRYIRTGERITQRLVLQSTSTGSAPTPRAPTPILTVVDDVVGRMPELGVLVDERTSEEALGVAKPRYLAVHLRADADWSGALRAAQQLAARAALPLAATLTGPAGWPESVARTVAQAAPIRLLVTGPDSAAPLTNAVGGLRDSLRAVGCTAPVGGASGLFYAEMNRMKPAPDGWDAIAFPITPQVHHDDDERIMQTLLAQPYLVADAERLTGGAPVVVEPLAFRPRRKPTLPATLDDPADPRESGLIGTAWLAGSVAALRRAQALTFLLDLRTAGSRRTDLALLSLLARHAGAELLRVECDPRLLSGLAIRTHDGGGAVVVIANLAPDPTHVLAQGVELLLSAYEVRTVVLPSVPAA
jgi:hypothetical protein